MPQPEGPIKAVILFSYKYSPVLINISCLYVYISLDDTNVKVSFNDDEILLVNRTPQTITTIHCKDNHGECKVISSMGELNFEVVVEEYEVKPSNMVLKYRLLTNGDLVSYFRYEWKGI